MPFTEGPIGYFVIRIGNDTSTETKNIRHRFKYQRFSHNILSSVFPLKKLTIFIENMNAIESATKIKQLTGDEPF